MIINNKLTVIIIITFLLLITTSSMASYPSIKEIKNEDLQEEIEENCFTQTTEKKYWALIIGVGIYKNREDKTVGSIHDANNIYNALIKDENWDEDNIKLITGKNATKLNIIRGFQWLRKNEGKNDVSLIYLSSHGGKNEFDKFPFSSNSMSYHTFATYKSFINPFTHITSFELSFLINRLKSQEISVIIDCCYSGGFEELGEPKIGLFNILRMIRNKIHNILFKLGFLDELQEDGRVILMSSEKDSASWCIPSKGAFYTMALMESIDKGLGDLNNDGYISSEEAHIFSKTRINTLGKYGQRPTIMNNYSKELNLVKTDYTVNLFDKIDSNSEWKIIDHTDGEGGNLWHISTKKYISPGKSWSLSDKTNSSYKPSMNNSIISSNITIGKEAMINFNYISEIEENDKLYFEISSDNWDSYKSVEITEITSTPIWGSNWTTARLELENYNWNYDNSKIQIRFRFQSEEGDNNIPGIIYIDDIMIHSKN